MNTLVLGGAGFIGCVLVPKLLKKKHRVTVADWGVFQNGADFIQSLPGVMYIEQDVRHLDPREFEGQDAVIDLAAISNDPAGDLDPALTWQVNRDARVRNSAIAAAKGVKRYVLASSCSVYGYTQPGVDATEESPLFPQSLYAEAAVEAERGVIQSCSYRATILRQGTVYGYSPRMRWDLVVNTFVRDLFVRGEVTVQGSGEQWRAHVYVGDTVGMMVDVLEAESELVAGQTFNVVGENRQVYQIAEDLAEHFGGRVNYTPGGSDRRSYSVSGDKLSRMLNRFCTHRIFSAAEEIYEKLEAGEVRPDLPTTLEVYRKMLKPKLSDLSARVFQI